MRIGGKEIKGPNETILVIPRPSRQVPAKDESGNPIYVKGVDGEPLIADGKPVPEMVEESGDIVIKARAVLDYTEFDSICPQPQPGTIRKVGQEPKPDFDHPKYKDAFERWATQRSHWMILKSLEATEGLEWQTVDMSNPDTWKNYLTELREAGFSTTEGNRIVNAVSEANGLDQEKYDEARMRFLQSQGVRA